MTDTAPAYVLAPEIPHNFEAEEAVLGSILIAGSEAFHACRVELPAGGEEFYIHRHRFIWNGCEKLVNSNSPIDLLLLIDQLEKDGTLAEIGGEAYLTGLINRPPTSLNASKYAALVHEHHIRRGMLNAANEIAALAYDSKLTADDAASQATHKLSTAVSVTSTKRAISLADSVRRVDALIEERRHSTELPGIPTPWSDYTKLLGGGYQPADLSLVCGRPGDGKTTALGQSALYAAKYMIGANIRRKHVALFSLEMPHEQITLRLISQLSGIDYQLLQSGRIPDEKWNDYYAAIDELSDLAIHLDDTNGATPAYIRSRCEILASAGMLDIVFVDSLNLMKSGTGRSFAGREFDEANICARELKYIAKDFNIPVVAVHQLNRDIEKRSDNSKPKLADLRDGGDMDAANVMIIWHERDDDRNIKQSAFCQVKHRNGPVKEVPIIFQQARNRFANATIQRFN
jgi:replicative DNA helicase